MPEGHLGTADAPLSAATAVPAQAGAGLPRGTGGKNACRPGRQAVSFSPAVQDVLRWRAILGPDLVEDLVQHRLRGAVAAVGDPDPARQGGVGRVPGSAA